VSADKWLGAWKAYMWRATNTINHGTTLPLAQGITSNVA
jgi:aldehyde dehydrogenase (NAD+)